MESKWIFHKGLPAACRLCPRQCGACRAAEERGFCGADHTLRVARAALHFWEEPCLSGERGSGTVFFSGCSLKCVYCQNYEISSHGAGKEIPWERLSEIFLELQGQGANNINLVTPTHYLPQIRRALLRAKGEGLYLPVVYNTSGYERAEVLRTLEGLIDVWLPDCKYRSPELALRYSGAADYVQAVSAALDEMVRQAGSPVFAGPGELVEEGILLRGVIVRHLLLPGHPEDTRAVIRFLYQRYGDSIWISLMNQYTPLPQAARFPELNRRITPEEYQAAIDCALALGLENGFIQEGETADESFIPPFDAQGV